MTDVPIIEALPETARYQEMKDKFKSLYNKQPQFFARAPGRVNLIGEHIDYCGYAVLPMAIEQDIVIAAAVNSDNKLHISNMDSQYISVEVGTESYEIDKANPKWQHYVLCGHKGIVEHFKGEMASGGGQEGCTGDSSLQSVLTGLDLLVSGNIPRSAGLSSSSALVCCAALVTIHAAGVKQINKTKLADICQHCEHYIGTEGGGMDQSISFLAKQGTAKLIEFNPIRAHDVTLPRDSVFVISNCCVESNKAATDFFNIRVAECRLATQILARQNGLDGDKVKRLGDVQSLLGISLSEAVELVKRTFHEEPYNKSEICALLDITVQQLDSLWLSERSRKADHFKLRARALHVYSEAERVPLFKGVCDGQGSEAMEQLGRLMYESHVSCRDLYECSCTQLDQLVQLAMSSGALGSRLTGAGWGGCAVSLVPSGCVEDFLIKMRQGYYTIMESLTSSKVTESLFATQPGPGAAVYLC